MNTTSNLSFIKVTVLSLALLGLSSCAGSSSSGLPGFGGPCSYTTYPGTATFTSIQSVSTGIKASFNFTTTDPNAPKWSSDTGNYLVLATGLPTQQWVDAQKLSVGTQINASRRDIVSGTCTPLMYSFPSLPDSPHGM